MADKSKDWRMEFLPCPRSVNRWLLLSICSLFLRLNLCRAHAGSHRAALDNNGGAVYCHCGYILTVFVSNPSWFVYQLWFDVGREGRNGCCRLVVLPSAMALSTSGGWPSDLLPGNKSGTVRSRRLADILSEYSSWRAGLWL